MAKQNKRYLVEYKSIGANHSDSELHYDRETAIAAYFKLQSEGFVVRFFEQRFPRLTEQRAKAV